jgi:membrane protein
MKRAEQPGFWLLSVLRLLALVTLAAATFEMAPKRLLPASPADVPPPPVRRKERPLIVAGGAARPSQIPLRGWLSVGKRVAVDFVEHRLMAQAAGVVFFVLLAVFPAIAALISLYGLFADPKNVSAQLAGLSDMIPGGAMDIIRDQIARVSANGSGKLGFGLLLGLLTSLWSSNQGTKALFDVLNVAYDEREKRGFFRLTLVTLCVTLCMLVFVLLVLAVVVVAPIVVHVIGLDFLSGRLLWLLRWPVLLLVVSVLLSVLYRIGPSREQARWQWVSWGASFAAIAWLLVSLAFSYFVSNFGRFNATYGSLGAVIGFMTWIWMSVIVVLIGAELNAELEAQTPRDSTTGPAQPRGRRGAAKADEVADGA